MNKDLTQGGNYAILPAHIRYNKDLTDSEKILFCEITALSNKNGYCYASNKYLSEMYGVSIDTISRRVNKLKKKGFVSVQLIREQGSKNIKERRIYPSLDSQMPIDDSSYRGVDNSAEMSIRKKADTPIDDYAEVNSLKDINKLNTNNLNNNSVSDELFDEWWKLYLNKKGDKRKVKTKFQIACKEVGEEHVFKATELYLKTVSEIQYVCGPEKFFNQKYYSSDAMETNKQIVREKGRKQVGNFKSGHQEVDLNTDYEKSLTEKLGF